MAYSKQTWADSPATTSPLSAARLNNIEGGITSADTGTLASRPGSGVNTGDMYYCTDIDAEYRWSGSLWVRVGGTPGALIAEPPTSGWSTTTLGTATIAANKDGYLATSPTATADNLRIQYRTLSPTSNYTATFYIETLMPSINYSSTFAAVGNGTAWITFGPSWVSGPFLNVTSWTNATTFSAHLLSAGTFPWNGLWWLRIRDDATTRFYEYSYNGLDWLAFYSQGRTVTLTPTVIGWGTNSNPSGGAFTGYARLRGFGGVS